ncbi:MAG: hypothetical protein LBE55_06440 [Clostridiales bacterium]|jgi:hypothetical protein|nr:hypothetical protein [Clostridiales bacterium]
MDVKSYFSKVFAIESRIGKLCDKIEALRAAQTAGSGLGGGPYVQKSRNYRRQEDISVSVLELEGEAARARMSLLALETQIREMSRNLSSPTARAIITWRYICRLKWKDIAERAQMSEMQIIREHNAALAQLEIFNNGLTNSIAN